MKKVYFSKDFNDILSIKSDFFLENNKLLKQAHNWNKIYSKQPKRKNCKNCNKKLNISFVKSHYAEYALCTSCGHFNGVNEDTAEFNEIIYSHNSKINLSNFYKKNYLERCQKIYLPKLKFLKKILKFKFDITDYGCGGGHFLKVCENHKIKYTGYEFNRNSVNLGNKMLNKANIKKIDIDEIYLSIKKSKSKVISLLGVIEHLRYPNRVFEAFKKSDSRYMFFSVPMISFTVFLEHVFPKVFPRLLGGVHNNLYSAESINYILKKYKFKVLGEWWFGSDMMGLMRSMFVSSKKKNTNYLNLFNKYVSSTINELQSVLDKKKICDEVHMIIKK